jgi:hypothetical protein
VNFVKTSRMVVILKTGAMLLVMDYGANQLLN